MNIENKNERKNTAFRCFCGYFYSSSNLADLDKLIIRKKFLFFILLFFRIVSKKVSLVSWYSEQ